MRIEKLGMSVTSPAYEQVNNVFERALGTYVFNATYVVKLHKNSYFDKD